MTKQIENKMDKVIALCKRRGFIFPGSDIYGGLANTWDYAQYGSQLKKNIKDYWWKYFITDREDMVGMDSAILMNPKVWEASGHVGGFSDPLMDCKNCQERVRGDQIIENALGIEAAVGKSLKQIGEIIKENNLKCPKCGKCDFTEAREFNMMFKTHQGVVEETASAIYLRPETAQGIFVNFKNILQSGRNKLPFGVGQIGKSFRNEITPGNFIFRTREFEQAEIEYFVKPGTKAEILKTYEEWKKAYWDWYVGLGVDEKKLRFRDHDPDELSHYSTMTADIEYEFPFGWGELMGIAYRGDFDLVQHEKVSGKDLKYTDPETNEKYLPHTIEPALGIDRTLLVVLLAAYDEDEVNGETRVVMRFNPEMAPVKVAVFPLMKKPELQKVAKTILADIKKDFTAEYDESGAIGKRYRRQDEIGTPYCITVDYESLEDKSVTVRNRDTLEQERIKIDELNKYLKEKLDK